MQVREWRAASGRRGEGVTDASKDVKEDTVCVCGERDRQEERVAGESASLLHGTRLGVMSYNPKARM